MSTYEDLAIGERFSSAARTLTESDVDTLIAVGGYTHPLFTDAAYLARTPFASRPVPGEGVLHVMGGLAEQTGRFDDTTIALVGLDEVRFTVPAVAGDALRLEIEVLDKQRTSNGKGSLSMRWRCLNERGEQVCAAVATMLFRLD